MQTKHQKLLDEYPFLTVIEYAGKEYLGIVQNIDSHVASVYIYDRLADTKERVKFLELAKNGGGKLTESYLLILHYLIDGILLIV